MCGVIASTSELSTSDKKLLNHRGPDENYFERISHLSIQFSRLSITGILEGSYPITSPNGRWSIFINGEIYNYQALIKSHGLAHTTSDVRVIALGLEKVGLSFIRNLRGMFAGVIVDRIEQKTYLLRDFFGEKPLYYAFSDGCFTVASEFRALLSCLDRPITLDAVAMASFARFGYIEEPWTLDRYIKNVPKGALSEIDASGIRVVIELPPTFDHEMNLPTLLKTVLTEAIHLEVPGGLALSGGLDSSAIARYAQIPKSDIKSYIFNFGRSAFSPESLVAYKTTILNRLPFRFVTFESQDLEHQLESLARINDLPHSDLSGLGYLAILRAMKKDNRKVGFFGHGPDEFFWGYDWFNELISSLTSATSSKNQLFWNNPAQSNYLLSIVSRENHENFSANRSLNSSDPFLKELDPWKRARAEISHSYLSANGHRQLDRLAMSLGIEPRTPYTDSRIYAWAQNKAFNSDTDLAKQVFRSAVQNKRQAKRRYHKRGFNTNISFILSDTKYNNFFSKGLDVINSHNLFEKPVKFDLLNFEDKYRCAMLGYWLLKL